MYVSVIGASRPSTHETERAERVGRLLAANGHRVVCGGLGGVMEAVAKGVQANDGLTIGIVPMDDRSAANAYIDIPITTGIGNMRNALVVQNGDAAIAIGGEYGTLSEVALALDIERPVVSLGSHHVDGVTEVSTPQEAVEAVEAEVEV